MQKSVSIYTMALAVLMTFALYTSFTSDKEGTKKTSTTTSAEGIEMLPQVIKAIDLNKDFNFAGESLPMGNFDVRQRLDRELLRNAYWHSNTTLNIKKAYQYFPIIEKILAENGMPDDLKYLAVAESDLSNAISPAGAKGFWQFMKGTAGDYKLQVNSEIDERYHLEKATAAACQYLKRYKEKFGTWTLAAAAYNMGASRLSKEMAIQRAKNYYDINLNSETSRYVFRIVAIKEILSRPDDFGFYIDAKDKYSPLNEFYLVEVNKAVPNWGDWAKEYGVSYRMLKVYNPWLVSSSLTNKSKKTYMIKIPK